MKTIQQQWYELLKWPEMLFTWHNNTSYSLKQEIRRKGLYKQSV